MKLRNIKLTVGTRLKPKKQRPKNAGAKSATPARQALPNGSVPTPMVHSLLTSPRGINNVRPSLTSLQAAADKPVTPAKTSAGGRLRHFELVVTDARNVFLAGSFNQWNPSATPMIHLAEGKWVTDLSLLPGRYEYLFFVNGNYWTSDPKARDYASNPFGGYNSVLEVPTLS